MNTVNVELNLPEINVIKTEVTQNNEILIYAETTEKYVKCRCCKNKIYKRHGSDRERKLKHLPAFSCSTYIIYKPHRYICEGCENTPTTTSTPSWHSQAGLHTTDYETFLLRELVNSTVVDVSMKTAETEESIMGVINRQIKSKVDWNNIDTLGILGFDEITLKKGYQDFVSTITSRVNGKIILLGVLEGREKATIKAFLKTIPDRLKKTIEGTCTDMYTGYINAIKEVFNNEVDVIVDRYHVSKLYRNDLDKFRMKTLRQLKKELSDEQYQEIVGATKILRRTNECLTPDEKIIIETLFAYCPELMEAYSLAIKLTQIFNTHHSKEEAMIKFSEWINLVRKNRITCFDRFIVTLKKWKGEIANYFIDRNTSGFVEGLNNKIKVLKRRCYGIYDLNHLFQRLFLDMSGYELYPINIGL